MVMKQKKEKLETVITPIGLIGYVYLVEPVIFSEGEQKMVPANGDKKGRYTATVYVTKEELMSEIGKAFLAPITAAARAYSGNAAINIMKPEGFRFPVKPLSILSEEQKAKLPAVLREGEYFAIGAKTGQFTPGVRPFPVLKRDGQTKLNEAEIVELRAGFRGRMRCSISPYTIKLDGSKGVTLYLNGLQHVDEGVPFGGNITFEEVEITKSEADKDVGVFG